ncbi:MAG: PAS domain S-box protein [Candidatus Lokiarchaeota archaeon]|nr:PAS domain S-box protein [Candidatus Lokiarchaeota archaeon]
MIGIDGFEFVFLKEKNAAREDYKKLMEEGYLEKKERTLIKKDGTVFVSEINLSVVKDQSKHPEYIIAIIRDVSDRKDLEKASIEKDELLKKSEERFRTIINSLIDIIMEIDSQGKITFVSSQVKDILGYDQVELIGEIGFDIIHPSNLEEAKKKVSETLELSKPFDYILKVRHKKGHYISIHAHGTLINVDGEPRILGVLTDNTEKEKSEAKLLESERNYRTLYETAQVGFWTSNVGNGKIIRANDKTASMFGLARANDIIGTKISDYFSKELIAQFNDLLNEFKLVNNLEAELKNVNGIKKFVSITAQLVERDDIDGSSIEGVIIDIDELKKVEHALKESQEMFQLVLNNIPQFIFWKNKEAKYLGCNENFARVAGVQDPGKIKGKNDSDLAWQEEEAEFFHETDALVMESDTPEYHIIEQQLQADGKHAWLDTNKIPLHDSEGHVVGLLGTYEDITERVQAEIALKQSEAQYKEAYNNANLLKDLFSHDINNILQSIQTANEIYAMEVKKQGKIELDDIIDIIRIQINRGAKLVNNIRKLSQLEEIEQELYPVDVKKYIEISIKNVKSMFVNKKIVFQVKSSLNDAKVKANEMLGDVFENILVNAIMYNENSIVTLKTTISREKIENKKYIRISFKDNGIGIEDNRKEAIFQRIYNKNKTISGVGLGLSLVKKIIESYMGKIWIEDVMPGTPSKGSNFIILLPEAFLILKF